MQPAPPSPHIPSNGCLPGTRVLEGGPAGSPSEPTLLLLEGGPGEVRRESTLSSEPLHQADRLPTHRPRSLGRWDAVPTCPRCRAQSSPCLRVGRSAEIWGLPLHLCLRLLGSQSPRWAQPLSRSLVHPTGGSVSSWAGTPASAHRSVPKPPTPLGS